MLFAIEAAVSGAGYLALALSVGTLLTAGFLLPDLDDAMRRKLTAAARLFLGAFLLVGILAVIVQGAKLSAGAFPSLDIVIRYLTRTQSGQIWLVREVYGLALLLSCIMLVRREARTKSLRLILFLALPLVATRGLTGHAVATQENRPLMVLADGLHMIAVTLWAGGLPVLCWLLWCGRKPSRESALRSSEAVRRFSPVALASVGVLASSGFYQSVTQVGSLSALFNTAYGNVMIIKLALVGFMLALGGFNRFFTKPALAGAAISATAVKQAARAYLPIGWEGALGICVLLVTGFLTTLPPAAHSAHIAHLQQAENTPNAVYSHTPTEVLVPAEGAAVRILSPAQGQVIAGDRIPLRFTFIKGKRGHHVHAYVDGDLMGMFENNKGTLTGIAPGAHVIELRVVTEDHRTEVDASDRIEFVVR